MLRRCQTKWVLPNAGSHQIMLLHETYFRFVWHRLSTVSLCHIDDSDDSAMHCCSSCLDSAPTVVSATWVTYLPYCCMNSAIAYRLLLLHVWANLCASNSCNISVLVQFYSIQYSSITFVVRPIRQTSRTTSILLIANEWRTWLELRVHACVGCNV